VPSIYALIEDAASAATRAQAKQFGQEVAAEARKALEEGSARRITRRERRAVPKGAVGLFRRFVHTELTMRRGLVGQSGGGRTGLRHAKMPAAMGGQRSAGTTQNQIERPCSRARLIVQ
jgi:hypothetical protein